MWSLWNNYSPDWYTLRDDISSNLEGNKTRINLLAVKILLWKDLLFPLRDVYNIHLVFKCRGINQHVN